MVDDEDACVRNIVKEIMRECYPRKIKVNKNFVTYLTKLLLINPNWGIDDDFFNQRENVQHFVRYIIEELLSKQNHPKVVTIKIQFYFSCNLDHMNYTIELNRRDLKNRLFPLKEDIFSITEVDDKENLDLLLKKIVFYITLGSGLGNPKISKVYEEALIAFKSILDDDELREFAQSSKNLKHEQLEQFTKIVAGIRLFNKDCDKGGEGMIDLPELLDKAIEVIRSGTEATLVFIMEKVNILTTVVDKCYVMKETYKQGYQMVVEMPDELYRYAYPNGIEYMKDLLIFFRQYELLIRRILEELEHMNSKSDTIYRSMDKLLKKIHETVYMRIAIPVGVVFPLFEQLFEIWSQLQDQVLLLSRYSQIMSNLETYSKQTSFDHYLTERILGEAGPMTDAERLAQTAHLKIESSNSDISIVTVESIKNIDSVELQYLGFCCWKLIETDGALIPGNPSMGIARYQGKNYVFSTKEGFEAFSSDPQMYINHVLALARRKPHLINFFQLREHLESVFSIDKLVKSKEDLKMCFDAGNQTVDHIEPTLIDSDYKWNIWDLKRYALTMANISVCTTVSTQTDKISSKNSVRTQTYTTKEVDAQTRRDNYSNVPKPSNFIYGLRGRKDNQQFIIDLTRPVDE